MRNIPGLSGDIVARATQLSAKAREARSASPIAAPPTATIAAAKVKDGTASLRLFDFIDPEGGYWGISAEEFVEALDAVDENIDRIELRVNSGGGSVWDGLTILNTLRSHAVPVTAVVDGLAASAASFIVAACDEAVMMPNSRMMIHDAMGLCLGQAADMREYADFLDDSSDNIAEIYAERAGGTTSEWRKRMVDKGLLGQWYSAQDAVDAGLADRVGLESTASAVAKSDAQPTNHEGREDAPTPPLPTGCHCGMNGEPAIHEGMEHRDECPARPAEDPEPVPVAASAYQARRHRMNAHRHGLPL